MGDAPKGDVCEHARMAEAPTDEHQVIEPPAVEDQDPKKKNTPRSDASCPP